MFLAPSTRQIEMQRSPEFCSMNCSDNYNLSEQNLLLRNNCVKPVLGHCYSTYSTSSQKVNKLEIFKDTNLTIDLIKTLITCDTSKKFFKSALLSNFSWIRPSVNKVVIGSILLVHLCFNINILHTNTILKWNIWVCHLFRISLESVIDIVFGESNIWNWPKKYMGVLYKYEPIKI